MVVILGMTLASGLLPIIANRTRFSLSVTENFKNLGNCFTAGIFLAMGLCHLVAEAAHDESSWNPTSMFQGKLHVHLFMCIFITIFGIECLTSKPISRESSQRNSLGVPAVELQQLEPQQPPRRRQSLRSISDLSSPLTPKQETLSELEEMMLPNELEIDSTKPPKAKRTKSVTAKRSPEMETMIRTTSHVDGFYQHQTPDVHISKFQRIGQSSGGLSPPSEAGGQPQHPTQELPGNTKASISVTSLLLILFAVSIHSLSTGLALGVQSETNACFSILVGRRVDNPAVAAHKWAETIAVIMNLIQVVKEIRSQLILLVLYSMATPVGIFLG